FDRETPFGGLRAGDAITGQQKAFRTLIAEAVRPHASRWHAPHASGRIADLGVGGRDHLIGVQGDVGAARHAVAVDLHDRRLVGVPDAGALGEHTGPHTRGALVV